MADTREFRKMNVLSDKYTKLSRELKIAEEEAAMNIEKDSYEMYLEGMRLNAEKKRQQELDALMAEFEKKKQRIEETYSKTICHVDAQIQVVQEKKMNTSRIRKLKAKMSVLHDEMKAQSQVIIQQPTPHQKQMGVKETSPPQVSSPPPSSPSTSSPKQCLIQDDSDEEESVSSTLTPTQYQKILENIKHPQWKSCSHDLRHLSEDGFQDKYGFPPGDVWACI